LPEGDAHAVLAQPEERSSLDQRAHGEGATARRLQVRCDRNQKKSPVWSCDFSSTPPYDIVANSARRAEASHHLATWRVSRVYFLESFRGSRKMKSIYNGQAVPKDGTPIDYSGGELQVPHNPIIPFIEGDGTGRDIWKASRRVFDAAVEPAAEPVLKVERVERVPGGPHGLAMVAP